MNLPDGWIFRLESDRKGVKVTVNEFELVLCKHCKHFELDHFDNVNGIPLITAHEICTRWGEGCKTDSNGFCFMGERDE